MALSNKTKGWMSVVVAAIAGSWGFHEWVGKSHLPVHLMTRAEAQTLQQEVKAAADTAKAAAQAATETSRRLFDYIERQELKEERATLDRLKGDLQETLLWESQNGENALSRSRKADLNARIRETEERIRCTLTPDAGGC
jgi:hypothetical protein